MTDMPIGGEREVRYIPIHEIYLWREKGWTVDEIKEGPHGHWSALAWRDLDTPPAPR